MKNILLLSFIFLMPFIGKTQTEYRAKEYIVIRIEYAYKKAGTVCRFHPEEISDKTHSLFGKIQVSPEQALVIKHGDNKIEVVNNETELLNVLSKLGWELYSVRDLKISTEVYSQYIFVK